MKPWDEAIQEMEDLFLAFKTMSAVKDVGFVPALHWLTEQEPRAAKMLGTVLEKKRRPGVMVFSPKEIHDAIDSLLRGIDFLQWIREGDDAWALMQHAAEIGSPHLPPWSVE